MDRMVYLNELYDCYKTLLTEKQRMYFEDYYWNNLSFSEIADNHGISRNAVFHQLKMIENRLDELESSLSLNEKRKQILSLLEKKISATLLEQVKELL